MDWTITWTYVALLAAVSASDYKRSKMRGKLAIACIVLAVTCRVARADDVAEKCHFNIPACDEIIMSPSFGPYEKALAYRYRGELRTNAGENSSAIADFT